MKNIYLDYAASILSNPSSIHALGVQAKKKLENAHTEVAKILGSRSEEIIFTHIVSPLLALTPRLPASPCVFSKAS